MTWQVYSWFKNCYIKIFIMSKQFLVGLMIAIIRIKLKLMTNTIVGSQKLTLYNEAYIPAITTNTFCAYQG